MSRLAAASLAALMLMPGLLPVPGTSEEDGAAPHSALRTPHSAIAPSPSGGVRTTTKFLDGDGYTPAPQSPIPNPQSALVPAAAPLKPKAQWTVLVYLDADNSLGSDGYGIADLNELKAEGSSADVSVVVLWDDVPYNDSAIYYVKKGELESYPLGNAGLPSGELNMGDPSTFVKFTSWAMAAFPADRYLVDFWDHGYGWAGLQYDDRAGGDYFNAEELRSVLRQVSDLTGRTIDLLDYDLCFMAQVEVYYQHRNTVEFASGSEETVVNEGLQYDTLLAALKADPAMDAVAAGRAIVDTYFDSAPVKFYDPPVNTYSVTGMVQFDALLPEAVNLLAQALRHNATTYRSEIQTARTQSQIYWNGRVEYIDLVDLADKLLANLPPGAAEIRARAQAVRAAVAGSTLYERHQNETRSAGISIYYPASGYASPSYSNTMFARETNWDDFLAAYAVAKEVPNIEPTVAWSVPASADVGGPFVRLGGTAADADGNLTGAEVKVDRGDWQPAILNATTGEWAFSWNTSNDAPGLHTLYARSRDNSGDYSQYVRINLTLSKDWVSITVLENWLTGMPGSGLSYPLRLTRAGSAGTFTLTVVGRPDRPVAWPANAVPETFTMAANSTSAGYLNLTIPNGTQPGTYNISLSVYAPSSGKYLGQAELYAIVVPQMPDPAITGFDLSSPRPLAGEVVALTVNITNMGVVNAPQGEVLFTDNDGNASGFIAAAPVPALVPSALATVTVNWTAAAGFHTLRAALNGSRYPDDFSTANNALERSITILSYGVELAGNPHERWVKAGESAVFNLTFRNTGSLTDTVALETTYIGAWKAVFSTREFLLPAGASANGTMNLTPPPGAVGGDVAELALTAVSRGMPSRTASLSLRAGLVQEFGLAAAVLPAAVYVEPGRAALLTARVTNTGNGPDAALLSMAMPAGWSGAWESDNLTLGAGETRSAGFAVTPPAGEPAGSAVSVAVTARSARGGVVSNASAKVTVSQVYSIEVKAVPSEKTLSSGGSGDVSVVVANRGNGNDVAVLSADLPPGITGAISATEVALRPGESASVTLSLVASGTALSGRYTATLKGRSQSGTSAEGKLTIEIPARFAVKGTAEPEKARVRLGGTATYRITVTNAGNAPDTITHRTALLPVMDEVRASRNYIPLDPGSSGEVLLSVTIGAAAARGVYTFTVTLLAGGGNTTTVHLVLEVLGPEEGWPAPPAWAIGLLVASAAVLVGLFVWWRRGRKGYLR